jgi:hypothetical protein
VKGKKMDVATKTDIKQDETKESIKEKECHRQRNTRKKSRTTGKQPDR